MPHGDGLLAYRYIEELAARGHELVVASEGSAIRGTVPSNITLLETGISTSGSRITYMRRVRSIYAEQQAKQPFDLVHQLNPVFCGLSIGLFGIPTPIVLGPYVTSWPDAGGGLLRSKLIQTLRWLEQSRATALILAGAQAKSNVYYSRARQVVIPYGIDTSVFSQRPMPQTDRPTIIFMGPIAHRKGIVTLIHAFQRVREKLPNALLRIAGTGEDFDEMSATIDHYALRDNVEIMGSIPRDKVPEYLASGHLLTQPSVGEPYGMSIIEAMAIGRAIVATAAGGFLDTVDEQGGRLVPVHDIERLAAAFLEILSQPQIRDAMGNHNAEKAKQYDWKHVIDQVETLYQHVLSNGLSA